MVATLCSRPFFFHLIVNANHFHHHVHLLLQASGLYKVCNVISEKAHGLREASVCTIYTVTVTAI